MKALTPLPWVAKVYETDLCIVTRWGAELWVHGLDVPARIEGTSWDGCAVDELANCKPGIWDAHIRPALSDRTGWAWLIGVPDFDGPAQVEYAKMYDMAMSGADPEWAGFNWPSKDILPPEEVESARRRMDPLLFDQEYGGVFVKPGGLAFGSFDYATHVRADLAAYDPALPINWALDFNVDPMCSGVIQHVKGQVRVIDEIVLPDSSTDSAVTAFLERAEKGRWNLTNLTIYGDASGEARTTTTGRSDWAIVRQRLKNHGAKFKIPASNPPIKDTLNAVRARLKNAGGEVNLFINPKCDRLIDDFKSLLWPSDLSEGHCAAWLRYFVHREYPVVTSMAFGSGMRVGASS